MLPIRPAILSTLAALAMVGLSALPAQAAPQVSVEVWGSGVAARTAVDALRDPWLAAVAAGGHTAASPMVLGATAGSVVNGVIGNTAAGTSVSVERSRYTASATNPVLVGPSTNQGTAACTGSGLTLQGSAPRPASLTGNSGCTNGNGTVYTESGGAGEATTRDAVTFTFSRPVWAFGAWFGDLETRTDGSGVPAIVRVLDADGSVLEEFTVEPAGVAQSGCSNAANGCGNNSTRWIGFTGMLASSMVVIVGDEDATGTALDEGMGFLGANPVDAVPFLTVTIDAAPLGPVVAGAVVDVPVTVSNTGDVALSSLAGLDCPAAAVAAGASLACTVAHTVTQAELDSGAFDLVATASASWTGLAATNSDTASVPLVARTEFTVDLSVDATTFDVVGHPITFTATVTNTGNRAERPDGISIDGVTLTCTPDADIAPGDTLTCTGTLTTTSPADLTRTATVTWTDGSADSNAVTVTWLARPSFTAALTTNVSVFHTVGEPIRWTVAITNTGNEPDRPDGIAIDGVTLTCTPDADIAPGDTLTCTGTLTTTSPADLTRTATVTWTDGSADSNAVTVTWEPGVVDDEEDDASGAEDLASTGADLGPVAAAGLLALLAGALVRGVTAGIRHRRSGS